MAIELIWDRLRCDVCPNPATHICIDEPTADDESPVLHCALCDDCYAVRVGGTIWLHYADSDEGTGPAEAEQDRQEAISDAIETIICDFREQMRDAMFEAQDRAHHALRKLVLNYGHEIVQAVLEESAGNEEIDVDVSLDLERELKFIVTGAL